MSVSVQCDNFPLLVGEVAVLWRETVARRQYPDELVTVRCVGEREIWHLNRQYRKKDEPTNILTFSYSKEHDVALCLPVAEREAGLQKKELRGYVARLLVHAFLHATGMDHEKSKREAAVTKETEKDILAAAGFVTGTW